MEDSGIITRSLTEEEEVEVMKMAATMESSTLPWLGERQTGGQTSKGDRMTMRSSEAANWTESEKQLMVEEMKKGAASEDEGVEMRTQLEENHLPEKAAQVFSPALTAFPSPSSPRQSKVFWEMKSEKSPFLGPQAPQDYNQHGYRYEWTENVPPARCGCGCPSRDILKMSVSLVTSAIFFPFLVWGGYVFLPFDAPMLDGAPIRLIYTVRSSVFAAIPVILGWLVLGVNRFRLGVSRPLFDEKMGAEHHKVTVHHRFVHDTTSLFLIYFLQLVIISMYLNQEHLKLVPLLTVIFALGRLVYWVAAAFGSSIRGFGFGLSFLPNLVMMVANIYFIFTVEASGSIFSLPLLSEEVLPPPAGRQRFWG
ncbi:transmembrane protein 79 [Echeneis naucrates]|uniref:transmembrane protein 79 n=1 Tax=Echeneis naucrates TaxID=173247 RepID=UPI001113D16A|nr:transmembrane protein 79 [Echeneis naucrates]